MSDNNVVRLTPEQVVADDEDAIRDHERATKKQLAYRRPIP
jgi:hypothetical protein